jgi:hypothetical protein
MSKHRTESVGKKLSGVRIYRVPNDWRENQNVRIQWNLKAFGKKSQDLEVKIQIARYVIENGAAKFHNFLNLHKQSNSGSSQFVIPEIEGKGLR